MKFFNPLIMLGLTLFTLNAQNQNPLLKKWEGSYGGVPAFNTYSVADIKPALEAAIQEKLNETEAIANNPQAATFKNTIAALELSGQTLSRVMTVFGIYSSNLNSPEFSQVETEMTPKIYAVSNKVYQNKKLFNRIEKVYNDPATKKLSKEEQRLVWLYRNNFVREGARADAKSKEKISKINEELAGLFTKFSQNLLAEENTQYVELKTEQDFEGLPAEIKNAAMAQAKERKLDMMGCVSNTRSSIEPFLTFSTNRQLREKAWRMFIMRGDNGNANDNKATLVQILKLRAQKAKLLGFPTFAHWSLSNTMAKTPERTLALMEAVWKPAVNQVHKDVADMQKIADAEG